MRAMLIDRQNYTHNFNWKKKHARAFLIDSKPAHAMLIDYKSIRKMLHVESYSLVNIQNYMCEAICTCVILNKY